MKKRISVVLAVIMMVGLLSGCGAETAQTTAATTTTAAPETTTAAPTTQAPETTAAKEETPWSNDVINSVETMAYELGDHVVDFSVELCDGNTVTLSELFEDHDLVMLNVWATWCSPCKMEFPVMDSAYADYMDRVAIIALSPYDSNEAVAAYKAEQGIKNIMMAEDTIGADGFVSEGYPTTILIDRFGNYVYYECGSILEESGFTDVWDIFLGDDYTESIILAGFEDSEPVEYTGEFPDAEEVSKVFAPGQDLLFESLDGYWPFVVEGNGIINSNVEVDSTTAAITATITAEAGQVFAFDYEIDTDPVYDMVYITMNGEDVDILCGWIEGTYAYTFEEAGTYEIGIYYVKDEYPTEFGGTDCVLLSNAGLFSGEEAEAKLAAAAYPYALEGSDFKLNFLTEGAKQIVIDDPDNIIAEAFGLEPEYYIVPAETAEVELLLGSDYDASRALFYSDTQGVQMVATEIVGDTYRYETYLSSIEAGGYSNTYLFVYTDMDAESYDSIKLYVIFVNEENVNAFTKEEITDEKGNTVELSWYYADGTLPATDKTPYDEMDKYAIYIVDENYELLDGVMINVCDDTTCQPVQTSDGYYGFNTESDYPYVIHVLKVPEGYKVDSSAEYVFPEGGGEIIIVIEKE